MIDNMGQLRNPFVIYGYKGAEYFCDRKKRRKLFVQLYQMSVMSC